MSLHWVIRPADWYGTKLTLPPPTYPDAGDSVLLALVGEHLSPDVDVSDQLVGPLHYDHLNEPSLVKMRVEARAPLRVNRLLLLHILDAIWWQQTELQLSEPVRNVDANN